MRYSASTSQGEKNVIGYLNTLVGNPLFGRGSLQQNKSHELTMTLTVENGILKEISKY